MFQRPFGRPQTIDLTFLKSRPHMAPALADVFWAEFNLSSPFTRRSRKSALKTFYTFLDDKIEQGEFQVSHLHQVDFNLLREFAAWLVQNRHLTQLSAENVYQAIANLLLTVKRLHPSQLPLDFEIPSRQFVVPHSSGASGALEPETFARLLSTAEQLAKTIQANYRSGDFPTSGQSLIPFMILIAAHTAMNAFSLFELRRDCLQPHPVDEEAVYVTWKKARSSRGAQKQLHWKRTSQALRLIHFLQTFTVPLLAKASNPLRELLFLYWGIDYAAGGKERVISMVHASSMTRHLSTFCDENKLPRFAFAQIRPSAATHNHIKNGGNLRKTQMLLGHKDLETTAIYINCKISTDAYNNSIKSAQAAMVKRVLVVPEPKSTAVAKLNNLLPARQRMNILRGEFSTGIGHCKDPLNSPQPGQPKGQLCSLFLGCLTCSNSVFFVDDLPRILALASYLDSLKTSMSKTTWDLLYAEHLRILNEEIIGAFSEKDVAEARLKPLPISEMQLLTTIERFR